MQITLWALGTRAHSHSRPVGARSKFTKKKPEITFKKNSASRKKTPKRLGPLYSDSSTNQIYSLSISPPITSSSSLSTIPRISSPSPSSSSRPSSSSSSPRSRPTFPRSMSGSTIGALGRFFPLGTEGAVAVAIARAAISRKSAACLDAYAIMPCAYSTSISLSGTAFNLSSQSCASNSNVMGSRLVSSFRKRTSSAHRRARAHAFAHSIRSASASGQYNGIKRI